MRKFLFKIIILILLPVLLLDLSYRFRPATFHWYDEVERNLRADETNVFVVGSSRTVAGIDAERATALLRKSGIPKAHVYNLGGPYSTYAEHYLGLRDLAIERPEALQGSLWLFETMNGLPERRQSWADGWVDPGHKEFLLNVLRKEDLGKFWSSSGLEFSDKAYITTTFFSRLGRSFLDTRTRLIMLGERAVDRWLKAALEKPVTSAASAQSHQDQEIVSEMGLRSDEAGIQYARQLALTLADAERKSKQQSYDHWESQIVYEWIGLVKKAGGKPFFFPVPTSSVQIEAFLTPIRREDSRKFAALATGLGAGVLHPERKEVPPFQDVDFPDLIHLRKSRRGEYTDLLMGQLLREVLSASPASARQAKRGARADTAPR